MLVGQTSADIDSSTQSTSTIKYHSDLRFRRSDFFASGTVPPGLSTYAPRLTFRECVVTAFRDVRPA